MRTRSLLRRAAGPLASALNNKLATLFEHVTVEAVATRAAVEDHTAALSEQVQREHDRTFEAVDPAVQTVVEASTVLQHVSLRLEQRLVDLSDLVVGKRLLAEAAEDPALLSALLTALRTTSIKAAPEMALEFVNWVTGHLGWYSQAGAWLNSGVYVELSSGGANVRNVSERTIEVPYALGIASTLPQGSSVLDLGAVESLLSLQLASLGYATTALDTRPYPFAHPNLSVVTSPIETWDGPEQPLSAAFCISTVEHIGLDPYGGTVRDDDGDLAALARLGEWLRPDGVLVLTVPFGRRSVDEFQRVYDRPGLARLLEGWEVVDRRTALKSSATAWSLDEAAEGPQPWPDEVEGVALVTARRAH